jgi:glycosyltransferase involved in cell wall biosynthesis
MTSNEEYRYLKKNWFFLPKLLLFPLERNTNYSFLDKKDFILVGNSRNMYNNHLDVLDIISDSKNINPYKVKMFLNYGTEGNYYNELLKEVNRMDNIESLIDFFPREEFNKIYREASALVMNCNRQMALGNIFTAIENNCKIYLNDINVVKKWFEREDLIVFSIEDFKKDYEKNNLKLSDTQARHNIDILRKMMYRNSFSNFHKKILNILKE